MSSEQAQHQSILTDDGELNLQIAQILEEDSQSSTAQIPEAQANFEKLMQGYINFLTDREETLGTKFFAQIGSGKHKGLIYRLPDVDLRFSQKRGWGKSDYLLILPNGLFIIRFTIALTHHESDFVKERDILKYSRNSDLVSFGQSLDRVKKTGGRAKDIRYFNEDQTIGSTPVITFPKIIGLDVIDQVLEGNPKVFARIRFRPSSIFARTKVRFNEPNKDQEILDLNTLENSNLASQFLTKIEDNYKEIIDGRRDLLKGVGQAQEKRKV